MTNAECVKVLFDYDYSNAEGKHIQIIKGDVFTLLAKSTEEWWKVKKGDKERFYVPANYVAVISEQDVQHTGQHNGAVTIKPDIPSALSNGLSRSEQGSHDSLPRSTASGASSTRSLERNINGFASPGPIVARRHTRNASEGSVSLSVSNRSSSFFPHSPSDTVDYANMAIIQDILAQRHENAMLAGASDAPSPQTETWEMHTDDETGRAYYYNNMTRQTTWELPVIKRTSKPEINGHESLNKLNDITSKRLSRVQSFRKGWTETTDDAGTKSYVHNATGEKWHMTSDGSGRKYYYKENGQESLWDLPEILEPNGSLTNECSPVLRTKQVQHNPAPSDSGIVFRDVNPAEGSQEGGLTMKNTTTSHPSMDKQKRGYLHKAKISEGKKKLKKHWAYSFIVANENNLFIYKDEKASFPKQAGVPGMPEALLDLQHATVDWASKETSARKNVLQLISASGTCYLLQHDDNMLMHQWHTVLLGKIRIFNPEAPISPSSPNLEDSSSSSLQEPNNNDKRRKHSRRFSKSGKEHKNKVTSNGATKSVYTLYEEDKDYSLPPSQGPAGEIVKLGIRERLKNFLTRRPTQESLEKKGILQTERVFGSRLQFICDREGTTVPKFVEKCIATIEGKGLDFDGLYRISGNQAQIQKLRFHVDSVDEPNLKDYDVNVLTGALKLFFRELKEPLIPFHLYNVLSEIIRERDPDKKSKTMKVQLATMPTVNLDTLKCLFGHLVRVHEHKAENRMKTQNIAIVFGPTLMWPEKESSAIAVNMMCQNSIVEYILSHFNSLF